MFWKKSNKNLEELEHKLINAEADLSFLNVQTNKELLLLFLDKEGLDIDFQSRLNNFRKIILSNERDTRWTIDSESKHLTEYINLYASLSEPNIYHQIEIDISDPEASIPALILFPIIENALINGYNRMENFPLKVRLKVKAKHLTLEVSNRVNHHIVNQADNMKIKQLESRLFIEFGEDYNLFINSNSNLFKITLMIKLP